MNRKLLVYFIALLSSGILLSSCEKYNGDVVPLTSQLSFAAVSDNPTFTLPTAIAGSVVINGPTGTASVTWTSGIANISAFKFLGKKRGAIVEVYSQGLTRVDLFAITPSMVSAKIDTGTYNDVLLRATMSKTATGDLPLVMKGNFQTAGGAIIPIEFDFNDDAAIDAAAGSITVDGTKDFTTKISIHLNKLFESITASQLDAAKRTNGTILITSSINPTLYGQIINSLIKCGGTTGFEKRDKKG